jgi:hypothetical protein
LENAARDETIRQLAQEKINKELDLVKHLKSLQVRRQKQRSRGRGRNLNGHVVLMVLGWCEDGICMLIMVVVIM